MARSLDAHLHSATAPHCHASSVTPPSNPLKPDARAQARQLLGALPPPEPTEPKSLPELLRAPPAQPAPPSCPFCQRPGLLKVREVPPGPSARFDSS